MLLSCQYHSNGVSLQYTPSGEILQAALEITMKNMDIVNIKPVCLLLFLLLFKPGFVEYSKNVYIRKFTGTNFWQISLCCEVMLSGFNDKCSRPPDPGAVQYCGCTLSKSSKSCIFLVVKNMLEAMNVYKSFD